jgi:hypothetical protein
MGRCQSTLFWLVDTFVEMYPVINRELTFQPSFSVSFTHLQRIRCYLIRHFNKSNNKAYLDPLAKGSAHIEHKPILDV